MICDTRCDDNSILPDGWEIVDDYDAHPEAHFSGSIRVRARHDALLLTTAERAIELPNDVLRAVLERASTKKRPALPHGWRWAGGGVFRRPSASLAFMADRVSISGNRILATRHQHTSSVPTRVARIMLARFGGGETVSAAELPRCLPEGWEWTKNGAEHQYHLTAAWVKDGELYMAAAQGANDDPRVPLEVVRAVLERFGGES